MASFMNEASQTGFDAQSYASGAASGRGATRSSSDLRAGGIFGWGGNMASSNYSVVGINTKQIPEMRTAIRNYVADVQEHLAQIKISTDPTIALKGSGMEQAVKDYIAHVVNYCNALCSNLLAFSDKLAKVEQAWLASDANMSGTVNGASSDVESASKTYTEQF